MDNVDVGYMLMTFLLDNYGIGFELGLSFIFSDRFNYYIGGSDDLYGYVKINKGWLCYQISKSYALRLYRVIKMILKSYIFYVDNLLTYLLT